MSTYMIVEGVIYTIAASVVLALCAVASKGVLVATNILLLFFLCIYVIKSWADNNQNHNLGNDLGLSEHNYRFLKTGIEKALGYVTSSRAPKSLIDEVLELKKIVVTKESDINYYKGVANELEDYKFTKDAEKDKLIAAFKKAVPIGSQFTYLGLKAIVVGYYKDINGATPKVIIEVLREDGEDKQAIETKFLDAEILYKMFPIK